MTVRRESPRQRFNRLVREAIADIEDNGFDSEARVQKWMQALGAAAEAAMVPEHVMRITMRDYLERAYRRALTPTAIRRTQPGVAEFTIERLKPTLRAELDRRIMASANLIKLNREASKHRTLQRFAGWASSIPPGGTRATDRRKEADTVRRGVGGLPFEERRVIVDQAHKLTAALNQIIAEDGGAIAFVWHHVHEGPGYQARPEHVARDGKIFVIRDNWAMKRGLMKPAGRQYYDEIDAAGEKIFCRCWTEALYTLRDLPRDMLTEKGRLALTSARRELRSAERVEA